MSITSQVTVRIGTRGSPLALAQAHETRRLLLAAHKGLLPDQISLEIIKTSGDRIQDRSLAAAGGKGLFTKELDEALTAGVINLAVHSMKDVPTQVPPGQIIAAILEREDVRDALISNQVRSIAELPKAAHVGTASLRRQAQLLRLRPDLQISILRGNVETRLRKVEEGTIDATLLALAGLKRLGLAGRVSHIIDTTELLPAVAQGAIGLQCRADDQQIQYYLSALDHDRSHVCVTAERAMLGVLDGSCRTPIAGYAHFTAENTLVLRGEILKPDGTEVHSVALQGAAADPVALGQAVGMELKRRGGKDFFKDL